MSRSVLLLLVALTACLAGAELAGETIPLKPRTLREGSWTLPAPVQRRVSGAFRFEGPGGLEFPCELEGQTLRIDADGDGTLESVVESPKGRVTFRAQLPDGSRWRYSISLENREGWTYRPDGYMTGRLGNQVVRFIDQNLNGRFDDIGEDAVIVGRELYASFLGKTLAVRDSLFDIEVSPDGTSLRATPHEGPRGTLDPVSQFATKGKLLSVVVRSVDGQHSFQFSRRPLTVPAGRYELHSGHLGLGRNRARFTRGEMPVFEVAEGKSVTLSLGEPVKIDFKFVRQPRRVIVTPQLVAYRGRGGEVYDTWSPFGGSPSFSIQDRDSGEELSRAIFGGT